MEENTEEFSTGAFFVHHKQDQNNGFEDSFLWINKIWEKGSKMRPNANVRRDQ